MNFWKQGLVEVPEAVWAGTEMESLILADNQLTSVSPRIGGLRRLRMLDLGHNQLQQIPEETGDLEGLTDFLYLHDNRLCSLPAKLGNLRRLRYLNIGENHFEQLPGCVCEMTGLKELRLQGNRLRSLPASIARLAGLRELHLRDNRLADLPDSIGQLQELRQLDLRGNPLRELPWGAIAGLPKLEKLDLRWVDTMQVPAQHAVDLEARGCLVYR